MLFRPMSGSLNTVDVPSGENLALRAPVSLFTCSSAVPPPEGGTLTATIGLYPLTSVSAAPSQTLYSEPLSRYSFPSKPNMNTSSSVSTAPQAVLLQAPSASLASCHRYPLHAAQSTSCPSTKPDQSPRTTVSVVFDAADTSQKSHSKWFALWLATSHPDWHPSWHVL